MKQIITVLNGKGGVGKSLTSENICIALHSKNINFNLVEIDLLNQSHNLENSEIFKDKVTKIDKSEDMSNVNLIIKSSFKKDTVTVLDVGSGEDTINMIKHFERASHVQVKYVIPLDSSLKTLHNVKSTIDSIGKDKDIVFVLNKVFDISDELEVKKQFMFFFGDKKFNIAAFKNTFNYSFAKIPFSPLFEISEIDRISVGDLAQVSRDISFEEATDHYYKEFENDDEAFDKAITNYLKSQEAKELVDNIISELAKILEIETI